MRLNERMVDRIFKMVNDKYPFFDDIHYKYNKDFMNYPGYRYNNHTFRFILNMNKIKRLYPNGNIDYEYIKRNAYFIKFTEAFVEYADDLDMIELGNEVHDFITNIVMSTFIPYKDKYDILYDLPI